MENLNKLQKEMLKVLDDTKEFYDKNPSKRGREPNGCVFETEDGRRCAIGRYLTKKDLKNIHKEDLNGGVGPAEIRHLVTSAVFKRLPVRFWDDLQAFHDDSSHWDSNGITYYGMRRYESLKKNVLNGLYG